MGILQDAWNTVTYPVTATYGAYSDYIAKPIGTMVGNAAYAVAPDATMAADNGVKYVENTIGTIAATAQVAVQTAHDTTSFAFNMATNPKGTMWDMFWESDIGQMLSGLWENIQAFASDPLGTLQAVMETVTEFVQNNVLEPTQDFLNQTVAPALAPATP